MLVLKNSLNFLYNCYYLENAVAFLVICRVKNLSLLQEQNSTYFFTHIYTVKPPSIGYLQFQENVSNF